MSRTKGRVLGRDGGFVAVLPSVGHTAFSIQERLRDALDPDVVRARAPGPVKRFSKDEIAKLNAALAKPEGKP